MKEILTDSDVNIISFQLTRNVQRLNETCKGLSPVPEILTRAQLAKKLFEYMAIERQRLIAKANNGEWAK